MTWLLPDPQYRLLTGVISCSNINCVTVADNWRKKITCVAFDIVLRRRSIVSLEEYLT
jgi:hypothetical protein